MQCTLSSEHQLIDSLLLIPLQVDPANVHGLRAALDEIMQVEPDWDGDNE